MYGSPLQGLISDPPCCEDELVTDSGEILEISGNTLKVMLSNGTETSLLVTVCSKVYQLNAILGKKIWFNGIQQKKRVLISTAIVYDGTHGGWSFIESEIQLIYMILIFIDKEMRIIFYVALCVVVVVGNIEILNSAFLSQDTLRNAITSAQRIPETENLVNQIYSSVAQCSSKIQYTNCFIGKLNIFIHVTNLNL